ncbi:MAG: PBP1A family penicillin-binding protein [Elusimicrobiota bacterium]|jgi:penicillin-binding protein 1A|nr:PBP1A family penicillin-binding protein [Elusimicrobiota bacterium]
MDKFDEFKFEESKKKNELQKEKKKESFFSIAFIFFGIIIPIIIVIGGFVIRHFASDLPSMADIENYSPNLSTEIYGIAGYDADNEPEYKLIDVLSTERRTIILIDEVPSNLKNAFLAIEDNDFFSHWGISIRGTLRAGTRILIRGRVAEGGSTLTQQLSRAIFLSNKKSMVRKIKEALLTIQLEKIYSKDEIMQFYMNQIYFGNGAYGVQAAARTYFAKNVNDLDLAECAMLAGIAKSPNNYNPFRGGKLSLARRNTVLMRMLEEGYITKKEEIQAAAEPLPERIQSEEIKKMGGYLVEYIRLLLSEKYGSESVYTSGFKIYTTIEIKAQNAAEEILEKSLSEFDQKRESYFKSKKMDPVKVQGAVIVLDPNSGAIRAMVGGRDFKETQFNRATQAMRQPGSSFKPFIYLTAIQNGYTAANLLYDRPIVFLFDDKTKKWNLVSRDLTYLETLAEKISEADLVDPNKTWAPSNYGNSFRGPITLRTALALSINVSAAETIWNVKPQRVIANARNLGINTPLIDSLALALGASEVILLELVSAYSVFDAGGVRNEPFIISKIEDRNGNIVEEHIVQKAQVITPQEAFVMTNMLRSVIERGSGYAARALQRPAAGKTGTTNDETDAWFIGYTPEYVTGVWIGYDDQSVTLGRGATGGTVAAPIWTQIMKIILEGSPVRNFQQPAGIEWALIDPRTGFLALKETPGAYLEAFISGKGIPKQYSKPASKSIYGDSDLTIESSGF